jgi:8-oxo-dGTP pyrophosphatase MutT (NUDIX family)
LTSPFRIASREPVLKSFVFSVERREVTDGHTTFVRDVVLHAGAVVILPIRDDGAVGILRQYRVTFDDVNWELPAGTRDVDGEPPEQTAARELVEEMGCHARELTELFRYMNSRGWTDQTTIIYAARGLEFAERQTSGPEEDASEIHWLSRPELQALLDAHELIEASTLIALLWYLGREGS